MIFSLKFRFKSLKRKRKFFFNDTNKLSTVACLHENSILSGCRHYDNTFSLCCAFYVEWKPSGHKYKMQCLWRFEWLHAVTRGCSLYLLSSLGSMYYLTTPQRPKYPPPPPNDLKHDSDQTVYSRNSVPLTETNTDKLYQLKPRKKLVYTSTIVYTVFNGVKL